ncbi:hypothetical protein ACEPPN_017135 [Leptodophora sp. 'Broadleaf-Isolate-01']
MCRSSSSANNNNLQIPTPRDVVRRAGNVVGIISDGLGSRRTTAGRIAGSVANGLKEGGKPFGPRQKQKSKDYRLDDRKEALAIHSQGREFGEVREIPRGEVGEQENDVVKGVGQGEGVVAEEENGLAEKGFWEGRETYSQHGDGMIV